MTLVRSQGFTPALPFPQILEHHIMDIIVRSSC
jgi:hypothetical protein